jgi:S-adenosylmethionine synthetase
MVEVFVEAAAQPPLRERRLEMCEHKGLGYPDTMTDCACDAAAVALAGAYRKAFGGVMHFNVDKGLLVAGRSMPRFNGGQVLEPARLVICGRAADPRGHFGLAQTAADAAWRELSSILRRGLDRIRIECEIRPGSGALEAIYSGSMRTANDTSFGVGFWPYTRLERTVLQAAALLRSDELHASFPAAGDDFKVMGVRCDRDIELTVALAMVDSEVSGVARYFEIKQAISRFLTERLEDVTVVLNTLDDPRATDESGLHLTVTGLSAEMGDDGQVGRGNRVNGLITPGRPMSLEAFAGKNPAAHVGKIYNVLATDIARAICEELPLVSEANIQLVSRIGQPIAEPWAASVEVITTVPLGEGMRAAVRGIALDHMKHIEALSARLEREILTGFGYGQ